MGGMNAWRKKHPDLWEFILFNLLSNCATVVNLITVFICTEFVFTSLKSQPFQFLIFNYTNVATDLGLCGFLSFLVATALAQTVNFFVQKNLVFQSNAQFSKAVPKYILLSVVLIVISAALPAYTQALLGNWGITQQLIPILATAINIVVQVIISYPIMKFWIMPKA